MKRWFTVFFVFVFAAVLALAVVPSCGDDDDDDDNDTPPGESPDPRYDLTMEGFAVGDGLYLYEGGQWRKSPDSPFVGRVFGAIFADKDHAFAYSRRSIYRYQEGSWAAINSSNFPDGNILDATYTFEGAAWFALNNAENAGFLIRVDQQGAALPFPTEGVLASVPLKLEAIFSVPGDPALHLAAIVPEANDYFYYHMRWDGTATTSELLFHIDFIQVDPPAADDDDTTPSDDDTTGDDDDTAPVEWLQMVEIYDMQTAPDGTIWASGYDRADDGTKRGAIWKRVVGETVTWERTLLENTSGCKTLVGRKFVFSPEGRGYVLAECNNAQIYRQTDDGTWQELALPGEKSADYRIDDLVLLSDTQGWAVGYSGAVGGPLLLWRNTAGWEQAKAAGDAGNDRLFAAYLYAVPPPSGIGEPDDDTVGDDDTTPGDDDTTPGDDDTTPGDDDATVE
jgi:hypothetical protein